MSWISLGIGLVGSVGLLVVGLRMAVEGVRGRLCGPGRRAPKGDSERRPESRVKRAPGAGLRPETGLSPEPSPLQRQGDPNTAS